MQQDQATPTSVVVAGIGGQGVLIASNLIARVAFRHGLDVKKSEVHGMSQRGGSVRSDVRFGRYVWSPIVPRGTADFLIAMSPDQEAVFRHLLKPNGLLIGLCNIPLESLPDKKTLNTALVGVLSRYLHFEEAIWKEVIAELFPSAFEPNWEAFQLGMSSYLSS